MPLRRNQPWFCRSPTAAQCIAVVRTTTLILGMRRATTLDTGSTLDEAAEPNLKGMPSHWAVDERTLR